MLHFDQLPVSAGERSFQLILFHVILVGRLVEEEALRIDAETLTPFKQLVGLALPNG